VEPGAPFNASEARERRRSDISKAMRAYVANDGRRGSKARAREADLRKLHLIAAALSLMSQSKMAQTAGPVPAASAQPAQVPQMNKTEQPSDPAWREGDGAHGSESDAQRTEPARELGSKLPTSSSPDSADNKRVISPDATKQ
jgi:hypothetical protein